MSTLVKILLCIFVFFPTIMLVYSVFRYQLKICLDFLKKEWYNIFPFLLLFIASLIPVINFGVVFGLYSEEFNDGLPKQSYRNDTDFDLILNSFFKDLVIISPLLTIGAMFYFL